LEVETGMAIFKGVKEIVFTWVL